MKKIGFFLQFKSAENAEELETGIKDLLESILEGSVEDVKLQLLYVHHEVPEYVPGPGTYM